MNFDDVPGDYFVSADKALLDTAFVTAELKKTYWGGWLTPTRVMKAIDNSVCFGLYERLPGEGRQKQIGFARVVTDHATFAWLCDVVVTEHRRGKGLGKFLVQVALAHPEVAPRSVLLCTRDAQKLYAQFGFEEMTAMKRAGSG